MTKNEILKDIVKNADQDNPAKMEALVNKILRLNMKKQIDKKREEIGKQF